MNTRVRCLGIVISMFFILGFFQNAAARDLIVVATKDTQNASKDWLGFLESKEIPVKLVTPDSFSGVKEELYIVIMGSMDESEAMAGIAKDALTADELKSVNSEGKMFYKPQAWNVGQKVILFLGPNRKATLDARISTQEKWYEMLKEWFDIEDTEGFHVY
ncbi:MAG: hypothetical protein JXL81_04655 [Deltaproteobacteria bacterium]|nr:hypothetical protein [Deltaproteobacteria bacterium]